MKYTIDGLMSHLRRTNDLLYLVGLQLNIKEHVRSIIYAYSGGNIRIDRQVLLGNKSENYNIQQWNVPALTFILGHEISHIVLGHTEESPSYLTAVQEDAYGTMLAIETHCNWFTIEQLGYSIADVVVPVNLGEPLLVYIDEQLYGFDPKGLHWTEIFERIKGSRHHRGKQLPKSDYQSQLVDADSLLEMLSVSQLEAIVRRSMDMTHVPDSLRYLTITEDKLNLPWQTLTRKVFASINQITRTWRKPNKKGIAVKGLSQKAKGYKILAYIDTSASVDYNLLNKLFSSLLSKKDADITIEYCSFDTRVYGIDNLQTPIILKNTLRQLQGGGGTDFNPVAEHWNIWKSKYDLAINITDGECELPTSKLQKFVYMIYGSNTSFTAPEPVYLLN